MPAVFKSEINMDAILAQDNDQRLLEEANSNKTLVKGLYRLEATSITGVQQDSTDPKSRFPGRHEFRVRFNATGIDNPKAKGGLFITITPERSVIQPKDGEPFLDSASRLWGQICKAFDTGKQPVGATIKAISEFPLEAEVTETYKLPDGTYIEPADSAQRTELADLGGRGYNNVKWIGAVKKR